MKKEEQINIRLTKKEREFVDKKVKESNSSISALFLNALENNISVNLDTSDYRDLVIQVRRIGHNINSLLKRIHYNNFIAGDDILEIKMKLKTLESLLNDHRKTITKAKNGIENLNIKQLKEYLEKENMKIPMYVLYDEISDQITFLLRDFIDLLNKEEFLQIYPPYIEAFLKNFNPYLFDYEELVSFSDEITNVIHKIDLKAISDVGNISENDFDKVMEILNKYRKKE